MRGSLAAVPCVVKKGPYRRIGSVGGFSMLSQFCGAPTVVFTSCSALLEKTQQREEKMFG